MVLLYVFIGQICLAAIVIVALWHKLDALLFEGALRQFGLWLEEEGRTSGRKTVTVFSHKSLNSENNARIRALVRRAWGDAGDLAFSVNRSMLGGLIIHVGVKIFDWSLRDRLRQALRGR